MDEDPTGKRHHRQVPNSVWYDSDDVTYSSSRKGRGIANDHAANRKGTAPVQHLPQGETIHNHRRIPFVLSRQPKTMAAPTI